MSTRNTLMKHTKERKEREEEQVFFFTFDSTAISHTPFELALIYLINNQAESIGIPKPSLE